MIELSGKRFGRLVVLQRVGTAGNQPTWKCVCDCGGMKVVHGNNLRRGVTSSCGCLARETAAERGRIRMTKHGGHRSPEYSHWQNMIQRCTNPTNPDFTDYGAVGVQVCERWRHDFDAFLFDMGARPSSQHSLDRYPDRIGNYEPGNVRWATKQEQSNNMRTNRRLTFNGKTQTVSEWARELGINRSTIFGRLSRGMAVAEALKAYQTRGA